MDTPTDAALVVSVHPAEPIGTMRINLRWQGQHELADFDLERLGRLVNCDAETQRSGWAVIEPHSDVKAGDAVPLR